jgi:hypothetical protein
MTAAIIGPAIATIEDWVAGKVRCVDLRLMGLADDIAAADTFCNVVDRNCCAGDWSAVVEQGAE